ncbi:MAG: rRNA (cytosine1402-N4)-methyltransferase [Thermotogota bacterium]|nr:rRNA (cytosine1402-N4)-methyltransferase [Thermotogota bacterium]MDK2865241.1 rRNA (cytosine1402-N4)-methyltransferase [Thermotogota bacterium]
MRKYDERHVSVLASEVVEFLVTRVDGVYVDCTVGEGGHTLQIVSLYDKAKVVALDKDREVLRLAERNLEGYLDRVKLVHSDFVEVGEVLESLGYQKVDGFLLDLGVSTYQLKAEGRGFSFNRDELLDMRMDPTSSSPTAREIVNSYSEEELARIIKLYGEEPFAKRIARSIVRSRPIDSTLQLVEAIKRAIPPKSRFSRKRHFATRTFQALRIEVNRELEKLERVLNVIPDFLRPGGRVVVISFHSLEDRIVKNVFREDSRLILITKKPVTPSETELRSNPRARSARMRVAERC